MVTHFASLYVIMLSLDSLVVNFSIMTSLLITKDILVFIIFIVSCTNLLYVISSSAFCFHLYVLDYSTFFTFSITFVGIIFLSVLSGLALWTLAILIYSETIGFAVSIGFCFTL